ncbi:MAG: hypothetical protein IPL11_19645 [Candidatus Accumulibacter sp.]|nr:hypothetical protein [Accumulibacter sp.]
MLASGKFFLRNQHDAEFISAGGQRRIEVGGDRRQFATFAFQRVEISSRRRMIAAVAFLSQLAMACRSSSRWHSGKQSGCRFSTSEIHSGTKPDQAPTPVLQN